jgi:molybdopterin molybdotransferase
MGISLEMDGVGISPGSSFVFGMLGEKPIFNLPGSPTASTVTFEMLVRPGLLQMKGLRFSPNLEEQTIRMTLKEEVRGKVGLRSCILVEAVVACGRWVAVPVKKGSRGSVAPMRRANGIAILPPDELRLEAGREVNVRPIDGSLW